MRMARTPLTPNADLNAEGRFPYHVNDGELDSSLATVTVAVASVNDAPRGTSEGRHAGLERLARIGRFAR